MFGHMSSDSSQIRQPLVPPADPIRGFLEWLGEAEKAGLQDHNAMTLATATKQGRPSARIVLFKGLGDEKDGRRTIQFFTNYQSRKSIELLENPYAALVFFWPTLNRQVRIEGRIERTTPDASDDYFNSRPRGSRIGAWASPQSKKISSREDLLNLVAQFEDKFKEGKVPRPGHWGGWSLIPEVVEFWQAGEFRLHDRFTYEWDGKKWSQSRLAP